MIVGEGPRGPTAAHGILYILAFAHSNLTSFPPSHPFLGLSLVSS